MSKVSHPECPAPPRTLCGISSCTASAPPTTRSCLPTSNRFRRRSAPSCSSPTRRWRVEPRDGAPWLLLDWTERGVPIAGTAPVHAGFGTELVSRRIPYELNGSGEMMLTPDGFTAASNFR